MRSLRFSNRLPCSPEEAWDDLMNPQMLARVSFPILSVRWITPTPRRWHSGAKARMRLRLFGFLPWGEHEVKFVFVDDFNKRFVTDEGGGPIRFWRHEMRMRSVEGGCCLCEDVIDFDAGSREGFVTFFAGILYPYRYFSWRRHFARVRRAVPVSPISVSTIQ